jgi:hypothetical protein
MIFSNFINLFSYMEWNGTYYTPVFHRSRSYNANFRPIRADVTETIIHYIPYMEKLDIPEHAIWIKEKECFAARVIYWSALCQLQWCKLLFYHSHNNNNGFIVRFGVRRRHRGPHCSGYCKLGLQAWSPGVIIIMIWILLFSHCNSATMCYAASDLDKSASNVIHLSQCNWSCRLRLQDGYFTRVTACWLNKWCAWHGPCD